MTSILPWPALNLISGALEPYVSHVCDREREENYVECERDLLSARRARAVDAPLRARIL